MAVKTWTGPSGAWATAGQWLPSGAAAASDDVLIAAAITSPLVIAGPGTSSSLGITGEVTFNGQFRTGALAIGTASLSGSLLVAAASALTAASGVVLYGPLKASGAGAKLTVTGTLMLGGAAAGAAATGGGLALLLGAAGQLGSLVMSAATGTQLVSVDGQSSLEIGTAGGAGLGQIVIDAGSAITGTGWLYPSAGLVNRGTILARGGTLLVDAAVSGGGILQIGAGAVLYMRGGISAQGVSFVGAGGTLEFTSVVALNNGVVSAGLSVQGAIGGFVAGDTITYLGTSPITAVTYAAGAGGTGTLTLVSGVATLGQLTVTGSFSGQTFQVTPHGTTGSDIRVVASTSGGTASAGTVTPDVYVWNAGGSGSWGTLARWRDATTGANPAALAPGANNLVSIAGGSATTYDVVSGPGNAASLAVTGNVALNGVFNVGGLAIGAAGAAAGLSVGAGSVVSASSLTGFGVVQVIGANARLSVAGTAVLGGSSSIVTSLLSTSGGATVQASQLVLGAAPSGVTVTVDGSSALEIGTGAGTAAMLTIDAGHSVSGVGTLSVAGGIANQGLILASGGTLAVYGPVAGTGTMQIGGGAILSLNSGASSQGVAFTGAGGILQVVGIGTDAAPVLSETGVISGFVLGDSIRYFGPGMVTSASYQAGVNGLGVLTLLNGSVALGSLTLAGNYGADIFTVMHGPAGYDVGVAVRPLTDPLFDTAYYLAQNPDVAAAGVDPYAHYMSLGWKEGRNPNPYFDSRYYLTQNSDVKAAGANPLSHFELLGWREGREPSLLFSDSAYLAANPDVKTAAIDPLQHYLQHGQFEGRKPVLTRFDGNLAAADPLVDATQFDIQLGATLIPSGSAAQAQAAETYHATGWQAGLNPDAWFDSNYYLAQNPDVKAAGIDPLSHFETFGWREGRDPGLAFSDGKYLAAYTDVATAGIDPLLHYLVNGRQELRMTFLTGQTATADPLVDPAYYDPQLGASIVPAGAAGMQQAAWSYGTTGWLMGLSPDSWFDTNYYLRQNQDVAAAHVDPLLHYETTGWREGRDPSAQFSTNKYLAVYADVKAAGVNPLLHYVVNGRFEGRAAFAV